MQVTNRNEGRFLAGARIILPVVGLLLAGMGVTIEPALSLSEGRRELHSAEGRLSELGGERSHYAHLVDSGDEARASLAEREAIAAMPSDLPPALVHGIVRAAARRSGVRMEGLDVGGERDMGLREGRRAVFARSARLTGKARPSQLVELVETLRGLGLPTAVIEFKVGRTRGDVAEFEFLAELGLLFRKEVALTLESTDEDWNE